MDSMLTCRCGHPISIHELVYGCRGDRFRRCACRLDPEGVLEAAVRDVRTDYRPLGGRE